MNTQIATTMKTIADLIAHVEAECTAIDREKRFDEALDSEGDIQVAGLTFSPSDILKNCDETAYRCGVNDYADGEGWIEINGDNYDSDEVEKARESFVEELQSELADLESEKEDLEEQVKEDSELTFEDEIASLDAQITALESFIAECEACTF